MNAGLIGKSLTHSYSKQIHEMTGEYEYDLISLSETELPKFLTDGGYDCFNVTIPYKKAVIPYCYRLSDTARATGSVNTVVRKDGKLFGYNTDYYGFLSLAKLTEIDFRQKSVAILGSGGTSNTVNAVLKAENAREIKIISRTGEYNYQNTEKWQCDIIVNTTPVGMYPESGKTPLLLSDFSGCTGVLDVIYNPLSTRLVLDAKKRGILSSGGLYMLTKQAEAAFEIFTGHKPGINIYKRLLYERQNIVLVGMPGCGKTTIGRIVAEKTGKGFIDLDDEILKQTGKSAAELISEHGEERFRLLEAEAAEKCGRLTGCVIACGGGTVLNHENYFHLASNGRIYLINRELSHLATNDRPLSSDIEKLYFERKEHYLFFKDAEIPCLENPEKAAQLILEDFYENCGN